MEDLENSNTTFQDNRIDDSVDDTLTRNFTKETLLGRLEAAKLDLKQSGELAKVETTFSALSVRPSLAKRTSVQGDNASNSKTIKKKI